MHTPPGSAAPDPHAQPLTREDAAALVELLYMATGGDLPALIEDEEALSSAIHRALVRLIRLAGRTELLPPDARG